MGFGALASFPTTFGGGALEPGMAIPIMLGAAVSGAAGFVIGAAPLLTTRGAGAGLATEALAASADFVEAEVPLSELG